MLLVDWQRIAQCPARQAGPTGASQWILTKPFGSRRRRRRTNCAPAMAGRRSYCRTIFRQTRFRASIATGKSRRNGWESRLSLPGESPIGGISTRRYLRCGSTRKITSFGLAHSSKDPNGRVSVMGLELVNALNQHVRAYYWWFEDASVDDFVALSQCPRCDGSLDKRFDCFVCEKCSIMVHKE